MADAWRKASHALPRVWPYRRGAGPAPRTDTCLQGAGRRDRRPRGGGARTPQRPALDRARALVLPRRLRRSRAGAARGRAARAAAARTVRALLALQRHRLREPRRVRALQRAGSRVAPASDRRALRRIARDSRVIILSVKQEKYFSWVACNPAPASANVKRARRMLVCTLCASRSARSARTASTAAARSSS